MKFAKQTREELVYSLRGVVSPMLAALNRDEYDVRRTLVISGYPRSGTTWLAEVVAAAPRTGIVFEPLNQLTVPAAKRAGCSWENFYLPDEPWPEGAAFLSDVLTGRVLTRWTASRLPLSRAANVSRWIVKFVRANQMLGWLVTHFPIPPPVLLMRHPCAVFASWVERGWPLANYPPKRDRKFFQAYPAMTSMLDGLTEPEEFFAVQWSMQHYSAVNHLAPEQYRACFYEKLVTERAAEVRRIFDHWKLAVPELLEEALDRPSSKAGATLQVGGLGQITSWQKRVPAASARRIISVLERFGLNFYTLDPEPDYAAFAALQAQGQKAPARSISGVG